MYICFERNFLLYHGKILATLKMKSNFFSKANSFLWSNQDGVAIFLMDFDSIKGILLPCPELIRFHFFGNDEYSLRMRIHCISSVYSLLYLFIFVSKSVSPLILHSLFHFALFLFLFRSSPYSMCTATEVMLSVYFSSIER